jgi:hypothetical protein
MNRFLDFYKTELKPMENEENRKKIAMNLAGIRE